MLLSLSLRHLTIATWETERSRVAAVLPPGLVPAEIDGEHVVSLAAFQVGGGRLGRLPVPPFAQLNLRVYVEWQGDPAVFFLRSFVTPSGMGGALLGAPYRPARLRIREGVVDAPGQGVSLRFRPGTATSPGELGAHTLGLFEAAGLRCFRIRRGEAAWRLGEMLDSPRADLLLAHGFDALGPRRLIYAPTAPFAAEVPPRRLR